MAEGIRFLYLTEHYDLPSTYTGNGKFPHALIVVLVGQRVTKDKHSLGSTLQSAPVSIIASTALSFTRTWRHTLLLVKA